MFDLKATSLMFPVNLILLYFSMCMEEQQNQTKVIMKVSHCHHE